MRIAFVDLIFSWPPNGGADVDLFHVMAGLRQQGVDLHLFVLNDPERWERGTVDPSQVPFPVTRIEARLPRTTRGDLCRRFRAAVDGWRPDAVFVGHGFLLKPYIMLALAGYPMVARYYAHEMACHRDVLRFKDGAPCPNDYLDTPDTCRACALDTLGGRIRSGIREAWLDEYLLAEAYRPAYHGVQVDALRRVAVAIVSNQATRADLLRHCPKVAVLPGGVDMEQFASAPPPSGRADGRRIILMTGRGEDPAKGDEVLLRAGELLWKGRQDFEIRITMPEDTPSRPWFRPIGWKGHDEVADCYAEADICVAPSVWEEPFGLVALEAMATGRPVCASRVGGLQDIVRHGETGCLFARGDSAELAAHLDALLTDTALRDRMGRAGRALVEREYRWSGIMERHYLPLLRELCS